MIPHKLNNKLLILAVIGFVALVAASMFISISGMDDQLGGETIVPIVTEDEAVQVAVEFAKDQLGWNRPVETSGVIYQSDTLASGYLAKTGARQEYDERFGNLFPLDYWEVKLASPLRMDEATIRVSLREPQVVGWMLETEEMSSGLVPDAEVEDARNLLRSRGLDPEEWQYDASRTEGRNTFVFVHSSAGLREAEMTIEVVMQYGNRANSFLPTVNVPDSHVNWMADQEASAGIMTSIYFAGTVFLGIAAFVYVIQNRKQILFRRGLLLSAIVLVIYVITNLNALKLVWYMEPIASEREAAMANMIMMLLLFGLAAITAVSVWLSLLGGEHGWRSGGWMSWPRWRDEAFGRDVFYGMGRGYLIALFMFGVQQVLFALAGVTFNAFAVSDPSQSVYNMLWPAALPLAAWIAAIMEEAVYRLFGIMLFKKWSKRNFIAILIPNFIWALGHTAYTIYPSYTRLIEVTVLGFIFSFAFLRYGFITAMFAHACFDSLLMGISLMVGFPNAAHALIGLFYILLPAFIGYAVRFLHPRYLHRRQAAIPIPPLQDPPPAGN